MRIVLPLTGEFISYDSKTKIGIGSNDNPVQPIDLTRLLRGQGHPVAFADFSWQLIKLDYEEGEAEIEITFGRRKVPRLDAQGKFLLACQGCGHKFPLPPANPNFQGNVGECPLCQGQGKGTFDEETEQESQDRRVGAENAIRQLLEHRTKAELYQMAGEPKLKKPFEV